jgi:hypothetical protein
VTAIEYRYIPLPAIIWPVFPDPRGNVERDPETGRISMSLDYWLAITHYVIGVESGIKKLEAYDDGR